MKICLRCGATTKDDVDYCPMCGRPVYKEKVAQPPIPEPNVPDPSGKGNADVQPEDGHGNGYVDYPAK